MNKPKISIIAAVGKKRELGKNNQLLWHLSGDLKHFKELTTGHAVIMGQKTYESIGRPLPNRLNIVLSKDPDFKPDGVGVCNNIDKAIHVARDNNQDIFIIGGGSVYAQTINLADKLYLTKVNKEYDADTFFPDYSAFDKTISESETMNENGIEYKFIELEKNEH